MSEPLKKPSKPLDNDCCGNSCDPCVWDIFYEDLSTYRKQQRELRKQQDEALNN